MTKLKVSVAMGDYDRTRALFDGRVQIDGVDPIYMLLLTLMIVFFACASLAVGALSDRIGRRTPLMHLLGFGYLLCWLPWLAGAKLSLALSLGVFALMGVCISVDQSWRKSEKAL